MKKALPVPPSPKAGVRGNPVSSESNDGGDDDDPFSEQPVGPAILRTDEKILAALREQLGRNLISLREYRAAAKNAVSVLTPEEAAAQALPGQTLRLVFANEKKQLEAGLITEEEFAKLRRAAVHSKLGRSGSQSMPSPTLLRDSGGASKSPRADNSNSNNSNGSSKSPRDSGASKSPRSDNKSPRENKSPRGEQQQQQQPPTTTTTYAPFAGKTQAARVMVAKKKGVEDAIDLEMSCQIVGTTQKQRKKYLGVRTYAAYIIRVKGKDGLQFQVVRRYSEFVKCYMALAEMFADAGWPTLPKKSSFDDTSSDMVEKIRIVLNEFLRIVCSNKAAVRSATFVRFIDPKMNPALGRIDEKSISFSGWLAWRKLPSSFSQQLTSSGFRRVWAVVSKSYLYFFPSKKNDRESLTSFSVELCSVEIVHVPQAGRVLELCRWAAGKRYQMHPLPHDDEVLLQWHHALRLVHASSIHHHIVRLYTEAQAREMAIEKELAVRKATLNVPATRVITEPSQSKYYYEKDKPVNILVQNGALRAGTVYKIVEKLLDPNLSPSSVVVAFVLTFHSYLQPIDLLDQLLSYYKKPPAGFVKVSPRLQNKATYSQEQLRVAVVIQQWIQVNPRDFTENQSLLSSVQAFAAKNKLQRLLNTIEKHVTSLKKSSTSQNSSQKQHESQTSPRGRSRSNSFDTANPRSDKKAQKHKETISSKTLLGGGKNNKQKLMVESSGTVRLYTSPSKALTKSRGVIPEFLLNKTPSNSSFPKVVTSGHRRRLSSEDLRKTDSPVPLLPYGFPTVDWDLFSIDPLEIARQLAIQHFALFRQVKPRELLNQAWSKANKAQDAPNVMTLIETFNVLSGIVSTTVVRVEEGHERAGVIARWIRIARICLDQANLACTMAIVSGLLNSAVHRMHRTWEVVKRSWESDHNTFLMLCETLSSDNNHRNLRRVLREADPPTIPYLGLFLQDLTFIDDGNKDLLTVNQEGANSVSLINFEKRISYAKVIQDVMLYQTVPYNFTVIPEIQSYFARFYPLDSEKLYARSLLVEPRAT